MNIGLVLEACRPAAAALGILWLASSSSVTRGTLMGLPPRSANHAGRDLDRLPVQESLSLRDRDSRFRDRPMLVAGALGVLGLLVLPPFGALVGVLWIVVVRRRRGRADGERERALIAELPELIDLLIIGVGSGRTIRSALLELEGRGVGPVADRLVESARDHPTLGFADRLMAVADELGAPVRPLTAILVAGVRHGDAVVPGLRTVAVEARHDRRRSVEESVRRLPVRLLGPLVLGVLPAFLLLTVVPLVGASIGRLSL